CSLARDRHTRDLVSCPTRRSSDLYGMILVEPEGGLPEVDREFYVMQGELYTVQRHGVQGEHEFSLEKLLDERPEHLTFNGTMDRSEEHTSELQSRENLVCRLLLEK